MDNQAFSIQWIPVENSLNVTNEEVITMEAEEEDDDDNEHNYIEMTSIPTHLDQIAAENLIYMAHDGQMEAICEDLIEEDHEGAIEERESHQIIQTFDNSSQIQQEDEIDKNLHSGDIVTNESKAEDQPQYFECQVTTEEIITDDWVQQQGEERVEVSVDQITAGDGQSIEELDVPLPTDQDEYTASRPYPCDFCSKRFKKKLSLMNHMIAHKNDRPYICNYCGSRYIRQTDLLNHLKVHANIGDNNLDEFDENYMHLNDHIMDSQPHRRGDHYYMDQEWAEVEAITKEYERKKSSKHLNKKLVGRPKKPKQVDKIKDELLQPEENLKVEDNNVNRFPIIDSRKPFVCQGCGIAFAREKALSSHQRIHANNSPTHECNNCNDMFYDLESLNEHQRSHHFEASNSEYEPEQADDSESNESSKYGEYYCNTCGMTFHRQDLLRRHSKSHIKKEIIENTTTMYTESSHCCNVCGENFAEALDLLAHAEIHARFQPFKCVLCGESFLEEVTIKKHLSLVHLNELTPNSCVLCGKACRDRKSLIKHAWDHSKEKNHPCSKCGKTFHNKARLKRHMVSHRNKTVACEVCHEEFPDGRSLMNHRHSHSNTSGKLFPCDECGKTFGSRSSQQIHVRIHTGERPYGCRFCWKAFADGGTLRKHERIHTGEKPYACSVCPRAFNQRVVLREHIRSHHSAIDNKRGTYYCTVCSSDMNSAVDLIQHLIQHSDMNTALLRQPMTGPRKYKRRRKLKPHELERIRSENKNGSDIDYSDLDMGDVEVDDLLGIPSKSRKYHKSASATNYNKLEKHRTTSTSSTNRLRKYSGNSDKLVGSNWHTKLISTTNDDYNAVISNLENTLQNIDTLVVSNTPINSSTTNMQTDSNRLLYEDTHINNSSNNNYKQNASNISIYSSMTKTKSSAKNNKRSGDSKKRPKMIHTQKTRISADDGKRKTKTTITRTEPVSLYRTENIDYTTTNINQHNVDAIIPDNTDILVKEETIDVGGNNHTTTSQSDLYDAQLLLEAASIRKEMEKYNPNVVNDLDEILRSPEKIKSPTQNYDEIEVDDKCEIKLFSTPIKHNSSTAASISEERRSSRSRRIVPNRRYLEYETTPPKNIPKSQRLSNTTKNSKTKVKPIKQKIRYKSKYEDLSDDKYEKDSYENDQQTYSSVETTPVKQQSNDIKVMNSSNSSSGSGNEYTTPNKNIKHERVFKCEMCSESFSDRAQLLVHVPIHI